MKKIYVVLLHTITRDQNNDKSSDETRIIPPEGSFFHRKNAVAFVLDSILQHITSISSSDDDFANHEIRLTFLPGDSSRLEILDLSQKNPKVKLTTRLFEIRELNSIDDEVEESE